MKNKSLFGSILVLCLIAFSSIAAFISCEVGLGEAVDVNAPSIEITTPETSAVIRDTFALVGNWSDDGSIKEVTVTLRNTKTGKTYDDFEATVTQDADSEDYKGVWSSVINPVEGKIPDGSYEASVIITDNGKHKTEITRTFTIDNTAPVLVLSRPSSDKDSADNLVQSYGQYLTVEGQAADDNDIKSIVIRFFSKDNPEKELWKKEITSIPPTISLDVAKFLDNDVYTNIYGDTKDGEKYYYCTITAYDSAKRIPLAGEESDDDELGNAESSYILWSDWEKFQTEYQKASNSTSKLKVPDLYTIKADKTSSSSRSSAESTLITELFGKAINCGSFKLNPENSPTFSISGLELGKSTDVENERALTVQLAKGLDGLSLVTDEMKVYLIPVTADATGKEVLGDKVYPQTSEFQNKGDGQFLTKLLKDDCKDKDGKAFSLTYGKTYIIGVEGQDIESNQIVPGFDGKQYYIKFKAKNVAPGLTVTTPSPTTTYLKKGQTLKISGTTSVPDGYPTISITCKKGEETTATTIYSHTVTDADKEKIEGGLIVYKFDFTVPVDGQDYAFDQTGSNQYVYDITSDLEDMPTTRTKTIIYDIDGPTISIDSMLPTAEKFTGDEDGSTVAGEFLNGDVTMKVAILDDYDAVQTLLEDPTNDRRPSFIIEDAQSGEQIPFRVGTETTPTIKHLITTPAKQSFVIHTEDIASGTASRKIKVKIFAQDRAGNLGVDIDDTTNTSFEREYTVDQTTDIPVILPYNADSLTLTYPDETSITTAISNKVYKSVLTTGSDLQLRIKDDDGVSKTTFTISDKDKAISASAADKVDTITQTLQDRPSDYNFRYTLPTISGRYECKIEIEDTVGKKTTKDFWIVVTGAAPQVTIGSTSPDNKIITLSTGAKETDAKVKFINQVEIESGYTEFKVSRFEKITKDDGTEEEKETVLYGADSLLNGHNFTDEFIPATNRADNKIRYVVTDEMNRSGEREFVYYLDSAKPTVDVASIVVPSNRATESSSFKFEASTNDVSEGSTNDGYKASGVSKIEYTFDSAKAHIQSVRGVTSLNQKVEFGDPDYAYVFGTEGKKKIYIRAIDDVGNIGDWVEKEFMYDTAEPELKVLTYKRGSEAAVSFDANAASLSFDTGSEFTLSGTAKDNNGIQTFEIWQKKSGSTYTSGTDTDANLGKKLNVSVSNIDANGNWTISGLPRKESDITTTDVDSGIYTYTIRAVDKSAYGSDSAKTTDKTVTVSIDKTPPTVTIDLATNNTSDSAAYGESALKGSAYTFRGTANDTGAGSSGFDTLYYAFTTSETEPASYTLFVKPSTSSWSIPMNLGTGSTSADTDDTLYEGKKYLYVQGVDKAGNESAVKHVAFMIDQSDPEVTCAVYKNTDTTATSADTTDGVVYLNEATGATKYTLKGTVSDANGIASVKVDGVAATVSGGTWSKEITTQGNHTHSIVVYDASGKAGAAGKHKEITASVVFDTSKPTVTVSDFNTSATATPKYWLSGTGDTYINGTANDDGAGLQSLSIKVDSGSYATIPISANWSYKYTLPSDFTENEDSNTSYHTVTVKAVDKAKNEKEVTYYFRYDKTPPQANLSLNRNGEFVNAADLANVVLSGYAYDNQTTGRAVESAKITVKKDGTAVSANTIDLKSSLNTTTGTNFGKFSKTGLASSSYADGLYLFTLEVKDKANLDPAAGSTLTASMTVDKTAPVIDKVTFGDLSVTAVASTKAAKPTIRIKLTEKNLEGVYYYVNEGADKETSSIDDTDWLNMKYTLSSGNVYTAEKAISLNDGKGKVYFKVVDKAGNVKYDTTSLSYEVDTKKPEVSLEKVDGETLTDTKLVNGDNAVTFTVKASDANDNYDATSTTDYTKIKSVKALKIKDTTVSLTGTKADATNGIWSITIPAATIKSFTSGTYPVYVTVEDTFGNKNENVAMFSLDIDTTKPQIKSYALDNSYEDTKASTKTFYMNNNKNGLLLTGVAYDLRGIKEVKLVLSGTNFSKTLTSTESAWTFEIGKDTVGDASGNAAWKNLTGEVTATLSVTDKAKNPTETPTASNELPPLSFKIKFDTTAPAALHKTDGSGKDIYFRVGDQDRDDGITSVNSETGAITATPTWSDSLDKDVGGKYKSGTFGNQETIKIRGNFEESGSGLAMIYYQLYTSTPTTTQIKAFEDDPAGKANGYFSPKAASETTRRVFYNGTISGVTADGSITVTEDGVSKTKSYKSIASTYLTTISGFKAGHNYLVLVAVDNVGNAQADVVSGTGDSVIKYYSINVDTQAPQTATIEDTYIGKNAALSLAFEVTDNPSGEGAVSAGIRSVKVKMNGVAAEKTATKNASTGNYEVTIPADELPDSGTYSVSVTAIDDAGTGNSDTRVVGSVIVDKTDPTINVTSSAGTGWIKESITNVSVSVNDINGIKNNKVSYNVYLSTDTSYSSSKANGTATITNGVATVASIATTNTTNFVDGKSYIVRFTAEDIVGNKAYANTTAYTVDRTKPTLTDADSGIGVGSVEVKTIANVGATNKWFNAETLKVFGTYTDEAGSVTGSGVTTINYTLTPAVTGASPITGSWQTTNGTYNSNLAGFKAGSNTLVLSAVDAMGNKSDDTTYTVKVDTDSPVISEATSGDFTKITLTNGTGNRTFSFNVTDSGSGFDKTLSKIEIKAGSRAISNGSGSNASSISVSGNTVTVTIGTTDLAAIATTSGTYSVTAKVKDIAGNESNAERIGVLKVDSDKPVPSFTSHQNNATVNKSITLGGTITDASNSAIKAITLTATCGSTTKTYGYPTGADGNISFANGQWSLTIDTNTADYNNTTTAKALSLSLTAKDEADNTSTAVSLALSIDQNSDRPVVKFTNLVEDGGKYILKYGNAATLEGTITDDDSTSSAVVTKFLASQNAITSDSGWTAVTGKTNTWKHTITDIGDEQVEFNPSTGDFKFIPASAADGQKTVYFYAEDNTGAKFYTSQTTQLTRPRLQFKTDALAETANSSALSYNSDSNAPTINSVELQAWKNASGTADEDKNGSASALGSSCIVGGSTKNYVDLTVSAKDGNGIKGIVIELSQNTVTKRYRSNTDVGESTDTTASPIVAATANINQNHNFTIPRLDLETAGFTQNKVSAVDDIKNGIVKVRVYVYDNSGLYSNQESQFVIDNTAPVLNITAPKTDGEVVYAIQSNTVGGNIEANDVQKIEYKVTLSATQPTDGWNEVTNARLSATLIFDNDVNSTENGFHSKTLREWLKELKNQTDEQMNEGSDALVDTYVHFKVTDECGNAGYSYRKLCVYPNGDKPSIDLVYPEDKSDHSAPSLAGTIRVYGYASVAIGTITGTYIQIDPSFNGSTFNNDWESELTSLISGKANYVIETIPDTNPAIRGIKATGTQNWNLPINGNNEFNPSGDESRKMAIRIYAQSDSKKISEPFVQKFEVDPNAPHIGGDGTKDNLDDTASRQYSLQIVDFDDADAAKTITNYKNPVSYKTEMWVKGQKYLIASVYDDSGIKALTLNENISGVGKINLVSYTGTGADQVVTIHNGAKLNALNGGGGITVTETSCGYTYEDPITHETKTRRNINIVIPLPTNSDSGSINWQLEATEDSTNNNSCTETIKINYDNTAPKLGITTHAKYAIDADIHQSDGFYTLKGYATDAEGSSNVSGIRGIAFYFMRRGSVNTRVYNPMMQNSSVAVRTGSTDETGITYSHGLYWKEKEVTRDSTNLKKLTLPETDSDIHAGGLALLGGNIYRIESVDDTTVILEDEVPVTQTTANFALALVVDNLSKKETKTGRTINYTSGSYGYGYYSAHDSADDGDLMQEDWDGTSTEGQWTAIINSANIPDGPIELHYVAFDKSQNYAVGIVGNVDKATYEDYPTKDALANKAITGAEEDSSNKLASKYYYTHDSSKPAYVSNNAPRIAGVKVGCDFDGNGSISEAEKTSKYVATENIYSSGGSTTRITGVSSEFDASKDNGPLMTVKDKISVELEVIGGNGNLYNQYNIDTTKKEHKNISSWSKFNNLTYYTDEALTTEVTSTTEDDATVYTKEFFRWSDVKNQTDATNKYYTDAALTTKATTSTDNDAIVYAKVSSEWQATNGRLGNIIRNENEGKDGDYYTASTLPPINFTNDQLVKAVGGATNGNNGTRWFTIDIWDSTEETTPYNNSQYATLKLPLDVQVLDKTDPNTFINNLYWNGEDDNSIFKNPTTRKLDGHIELKDYLGTGFTAANYGTDDDKISGKVVFRGYAYDNKRLSRLTWGIKDNLSGTIKEAWPRGYITDATYDSSTATWTNAGRADIGNPYYYLKIYDDAAHGAYLNENGHRIYWELTIDTSYVQEPGKSDDPCWAVGKDLYVYVQATDSSNRTTNMNPTNVMTGTDSAILRPNYKVDVVPYITGIKSRLDYNRSSNGRYQIADNETGLQLLGYNLSKDNQPITLTVPASSGYYVETIQGCPTINNMNNNAAVGTTPEDEQTYVENKYNYQPDSYNDSLTDDVYIQLWQFNNRAAQTNTGVGFIAEPVMAFNPVNGNLGFAFSNGANKFSMAMGKNHEDNVAQTSYTYWEMNYAKYIRNAISFDESGRSHGISVGIDTMPSSGKAGRMNYFYSSWGTSQTGSEGGNFNNNTNSLHIDTIGVPNADDYTQQYPVGGDTDTAWASTVIVEERFGTPSIVSVNHNNVPTVYIAYYDDVLERIVFRWGTVTDTDAPAKENQGQWNQRNKPAGYNNLTTTTQGERSFPITQYSLIAGGKNPAGTEALTPYSAGEYVNLAVVKGTSTANDVVCVVWYDAIHDRLMYNYKTNPCNNRNADSTHTTTSGYWAEAKVLKEKCGQYCKIAVDANGGIHIAAYDSGNKGVGYVYLPKYNSSYSVDNDYYLIDAMNGPFDELGITVAVDGTSATGKAYPTISYYANGSPKMATYSTGITKPAATNPDKPSASWANGKFTGNWDVCYVPTKSQLLKDHVNVVQPQGTTGVIARVSTTNNFATNGGKDNGTVTGNTTTNPILGYAIREGSKGYLEIAQRK